jgi:hypothetical protein
MNSYDNSDTSSRTESGSTVPADDPVGEQLRPLTGRLPRAGGVFVDEGLASVDDLGHAAGADRLERPAGVLVGPPPVVSEELEVPPIIDLPVDQHQGDQLALPLNRQR